MLHGLTANGACWTEVANFLPRDYDVILPDARGHGNSSKPDVGYRCEELAEDVVGLIHSLEISPSVLVGHSIGGMTAAVVASRYPNLIRGLVLADPTFLSPERQREVFESDVASEHRRLLDRSLEDIVAESRIRHPHRSRETLERIARARLQTSMKAFDILIPPNPDFRKLMSAIRVPSLLVISENGGVISPKVAAELQHLNPSLRIEKIRDAGHGLHYDQPERFAAVLQAFLRSFAE